MKLTPIITSLLENDFYKFTMGQWIFHQFNHVRTHWGFKCRTPGVRFTSEMVSEIKAQVAHYCSLKFSTSELDYLRGISYLKQDYIDYLSQWRPNAADICIGSDSPCGLSVEICGLENRISYYETPVMAIICEVFYRLGGAKKSYETLFEGYKKQVADVVSGIKSGRYRVGFWSDFGFRRRLSKEAQAHFLGEVTGAKVAGFVGTSNVFLAKCFGVKPVGSVGHQATQLMQGLTQNPAYANKHFLESWHEEYGEVSGIALTDCIGTDVFLLDFLPHFAATFDGVRHDSADPYVWGEKLLRHYELCGIDPRTKTFLFSDGLSFERATQIWDYFHEKARVAFGIGASCCSPKGDDLNIVIKIIDVEERPVAKLSDVPITPTDPGKSMCRDPKFIALLQRLVKERLSVSLA